MRNAGPRRSRLIAFILMALLSLSVLPGAVHGVAGGAGFSGKVAAERRTNATGITLKLTDGVSAFTATPDATGTFSFSALPDGVYTLTATRSGHLKQQISVVVADGEVRGVPDDLLLTLPFGDVDGNGDISPMDASLLMLHYLQVADATTLDSLDIVADGNVDVYDLSVLTRNYGRSASPPTIYVEPVTGEQGGQVTLSATLSAVGQGGISGKSLRFTVGGSPAGTKLTGFGGGASLSHTITLGPGAHDIMVEYMQGGVVVTRTTGRLTVKPPLDPLTVDAVTARYGDAVALSARLAENGQPVSGRPVSFTVGEDGLGIATTGDDGVATYGYTISKPAGTYTVKAIFQGDATYASSAGTATLTVAKRPATITYAGPTQFSGGEVPLSATVTSDGGDIYRAGQITFTLTPSSGSALTFTAEVDDWGGATVTPVVPAGTYSVQVSLQSEYYTADPFSNTPPTAADDSYMTLEDTPLIVAAPGVLANDSDSDPLTAVLVSGPANGTLVLNEDGTFSYVPDDNYYGTDSFTYRAYDGAAYSDSATVTITVTSVNDAPTIAAPTTLPATEDLPIKLDGLITVGDVDADGQVELSLSATSGVVSLGDLSGLTVAAGANSSHEISVTGTLAALNAALSQLAFNPAPDFHGNAVIDLTLDDLGLSGSGGAKAATHGIEIVVAPVNDQPATVPDAKTTPAGAPVELFLTATDADGDILSFSLGTAPSLGSLGELTFSGCGLVEGEWVCRASVLYTPTFGLTGTDSVAFEVRDPDGATATGLFTVTVLNGDDAEAPTFTAHGYDLDGDQAPSAGDTLVVYFSEPTNKPDLTDALTGPVSYTAVWNEHGTALTIMLGGPVEKGAQFKVDGTLIWDAAGNRLAAEGLVTLATVDLTHFDFMPPTVIGSAWIDMNKDGAIGAGDLVRVTFSEPVELSTEGVAFGVTYGMVGTESAVLSEDGRELTITLTTADNIVDGTRLYISDGSLISDLAGNPAGAPQSPLDLHTFDLLPPAVVYAYGIDQDGDGAGTGGDHIIVHFSEPVPGKPVLTGAHIWAPGARDLTTSWNADGTELTITLGPDSHVYRNAGFWMDDASMIADAGGHAPEYLWLYTLLGAHFNTESPRIISSYASGDTIYITFSEGVYAGPPLTVADLVIPGAVDPVLVWTPDNTVVKIVSGEGSAPADSLTVTLTDGTRLHDRQGNVLGAGPVPLFPVDPGPWVTDSEHWDRNERPGIQSGDAFEIYFSEATNTPATLELETDDGTILGQTTLEWVHPDFLRIRLVSGYVGGSQTPGIYLKDASQLTDLAGHPIGKPGERILLYKHIDEVGPEVTRSLQLDMNHNQMLDEGDQIVIFWDEPVVSAAQVTSGSFTVSAGTLNVASLTWANDNREMTITVGAGTSIEPYESLYINDYRLIMDAAGNHPDFYGEGLEYWLTDFSDMVGPELLEFTYQDLNNNGQVDAGDEVLLTFADWVDWNGSVSDITFNQGALTAEQVYTDYHLLYVKLGGGSAPSGTEMRLSDSTKITDWEGDPLGGSAPLLLGTLVATPADHAPPTISLSTHENRNENGTIDMYDVITVQFSESTNTPELSAEDFEVEGTTVLGAITASWDDWGAPGDTLKIWLHDDFVLGEPALRIKLKDGSKITDLKGNPLGTGPVLLTEGIVDDIHPRMDFVRGYDLNNTGKLDQGDQIELEFNEPIRLARSLVTGDISTSDPDGQVVVAATTLSGETLTITMGAGTSVTKGYSLTMLGYGAITDLWGTTLQTGGPFYTLDSYEFADPVTIVSAVGYDNDYDGAGTEGDVIAVVFSSEIATRDSLTEDSFTIPGAAGVDIAWSDGGTKLQITLRAGSYVAVGTQIMVDGTAFQDWWFGKLADGPAAIYTFSSTEFVADMTPPAVLRTSYFDADNSGTVNAGDMVRVLFTEPVRSVGTIGSLLTSDLGVTIAIASGDTATLNGDLLEVVLGQLTSIPANGRLLLTDGSKITDRRGNTLGTPNQPVTLVTFDGTTDTAAPTIVGITAHESNGGFGLMGSSLEVTFSEPIITPEGDLSRDDLDGWGLGEVTMSWSNNRTVLTILLGDGSELMSDLTLVDGSRLTDLWGNPLAPEGTAVTLAPLLVDYSWGSDEDGDGWVSGGDTVTVEFSQPTSGAQLSAADFEFSDSAIAPDIAAVRWDQGKRILTIEFRSGTGIGATTTLRLKASSLGKLTGPGGQPLPDGDLYTFDPYDFYMYGSA